MSRTPKILVVGSLVMDMITATDYFPSAGETKLGHGFKTAPGGKGANQAMQAALLGAEVTMVGKVGNDAFGSELITSLKSSGVDVKNILRSNDAPSGIGNIILTTKDGVALNNRITVVPGANMLIAPEEVEFLRDIINQYDMVILQMEIPMDVNEAVAEMAMRADVPVMLNPAPYSPISEKLIRNVSYISPNETEVSAMLGVELRAESSEITKQDIEKISAAMKKADISQLIVTLGDCGAAIINDDKIKICPCIQGVKVIDPTAAGDSFVGAFCTGICVGLSKEEAIYFANCTAAITVSGMGAMPSLPSIDMVKAFIQERNLDFFDMKKIDILKYKTKNDRPDSLDVFVSSVRKHMEETLSEPRREELFAAARLVENAVSNGNRIHVTGIGKPGHIAGYIASLMSSTGTPTYFLHGTEAVHGSCGQLVEGDVVICISNSGETSEMRSTVLAVKNNGCSVIGISGNSESWLANQSDVHLLASIHSEGGPLNRAPRNSILAETIVLQELSVILQEHRAITPQEYVLRHPGGALGQLRKGE